MTPERAQELVIEHGCSLRAGSTTCLSISNESINFLFTVSLSDLPTIEEGDFISTITTGRTRRGRRQLPGSYRDYHNSGW